MLKNGYYKDLNITFKWITYVRVLKADSSDLLEKQIWQKCDEFMNVYSYISVRVTEIFLSLIPPQQIQATDQTT